MTIAEANNLGKEIVEQIEAESFELLSYDDVTPYLLIIIFKEGHSFFPPLLKKVSNNNYFIDVQDGLLNVNISI